MTQLLVAKIVKLDAFTRKASRYSLIFVHLFW